MGRKRRSFLAGLVAVIASLAGCSSPLEDQLQSDDGGPPPLFGLEIDNFETEPHDVGVLVRRNNEIVHWERHAISAAQAFEGTDATRGTGLVVESSAWPGCRVYEILARLDDVGAWTQLDFSEQTFSTDPGAPRMARVLIRNDGSFSSLTVPVDQTLDCSTT